MEPFPLSRRQFLRGAAAAGMYLGGCASLPGAGVRVVDIHQHVPYRGRTLEGLVAHQREMGASRTVLLPAGRKFGLAAGVGGNDEALEAVRRHPGELVFFANECPDIPETREVLEKYLRLGAIGIGEQKFPVDCDSPPIRLVAEIAREHDVPVLLHFEEKAYNFHFERFHRILGDFPTVNFIGHAITWWGSIDRDYVPAGPYPKGPVAAGGLTDRFLSDYANMFGDLSAKSGWNALSRDEDHARGFLERHQDKLLYGSDCRDTEVGGPECSGAHTLALLRRLSPGGAALRKILHDNAARVLRMPVTPP